jgi:ABC-type phosphate transport system substrate-binding protein
MKRSTLLLATVLTAASLAVSGVAASPALAVGNPVIQDCYTHGKLTQSYSRSELQHALNHMSSYIKQYSNCQSAIEAALQNATGVQANGSGGGGGSSISTGLIIVIVVVALAIVAFGALLIRRRRALGRRPGP